MSHALHFTGPFIKEFHTLNAGVDAEHPLGGIWAFSRNVTHPVYTQAQNTISYVPSPFRRVYLIVQNIGTQDATIYLQPLESIQSQQIVIKAGSTFSIDNYNGPLMYSAESTLIASEAFA